MSAATEAAPASPTPATEFAIPQISIASAPAVEVRDLASGRSISNSELLEELAALGTGWRLETRNEFNALVDLGYRNQHGAVSRDESLHPAPYWTSERHPLDPTAHVVVWFDDGVVDDHCGGRARARAVRVAGQSSDL